MKELGYDKVSSEQHDVLLFGSIRERILLARHYIPVGTKGLIQC